MEKITYTYAIAKSVCEREKDYLDCFWPFTIRVLPQESGSLELTEIKERVRTNYQLDIPLHTLTAIISRAEKKNLISKFFKGFQLTKDGFDYLKTLESESDVERRLNALYNDIHDFLSGKMEETTNQKDIEGALIALIRRNIEPIAEFFGKSGTTQNKIGIKESNKEIKKWLIQYMQLAEREKPDHYKTLKDIFCGSVVVSVLNLDNPKKISDFKLGRFDHTTVYLDSNIVFSLLGLDPDEFCAPIKELYELLKKEKFTLKIFGFTLDEMCKLLNGYISEEYKYMTGIRVYSLYSSMKRKGWTQISTRELIQNIETTLHEKGIEVDWSNEVDLNEYVAVTPEIRAKLMFYKPDQQKFHQNHDIAAIEIIKKMRGHPVRRIENAKVIFISSDRRLCRFDFEKMGHKNTGTIAYAIPDSLLTSILWLKNPKANISLNSVIATYSRDLFINNRVWEKFHDILYELKQKQKINEENTSTLFYHGFIEDELRQIEEKDIDKINEEYVLTKIEESSKLKEEEDFKKEKIVLELKKINKDEQEKNQKWFEQFSTIKYNLRKQAEKSGKIRSIIYSTLITLALLGVAYYICTLNIYEYIKWSISIILGGGGLFFVWKSLEKKINNKLTQSIYNKKLIELEIDTSK